MQWMATNTTEYNGIFFNICLINGTENFGLLIPYFIYGENQAADLCMSIKILKNEECSSTEECFLECSRFWV